MKVLAKETEALAAQEEVKEAIKKMLEDRGIKEVLVYVEGKMYSITKVGWR